MAYSFEENVKKGTLHHGFIIEGSYNIDKLSYGKKIAMGILCAEKPGVGCGQCNTCKKVLHDNYLDLYIIEPEMAKNSKTKSVKTKDIEELIKKLNRKPYDGDRNIAIIDGADHITIDAYNKLLKTIEEPPEGTVIILLSENSTKIPQTIRSRCVKISLNDYNIDDKVLIDISDAQTLIDMMLSGSDFYEINHFFKQNIKFREEAYALLDAMEEVYIKIMHGQYDEYKRTRKEYIFNAVRYVEMARVELLRNSNVQYTLKKMVLNIGG